MLFSWLFLVVRMDIAYLKRPGGGECGSDGGRPCPAGGWFFVWFFGFCGLVAN
jgi:hypothetical protein